MIYILNENSIKVNWTMLSQTTGYVIVINSTTVCVLNEKKRVSYLLVTIIITTIITIIKQMVILMLHLSLYVINLTDKILL